MDERAAIFELTAALGKAHERARQAEAERDCYKAQRDELRKQLDHFGVFEALDIVNLSFSPSDESAYLRSRDEAWREATK